jgi:hypothetical protein
MEEALAIGKTSFTDVRVVIMKKGDDGKIAARPAEEQWTIVKSDAWQYGKLREHLAKEYQPMRKKTLRVTRVGRAFLKLEEPADMLAHLTFAFEQAPDAVKEQFMAVTDAPWLNEHEKENGA